jgi:Type II secretion system (T2SS), protein M
MTTRDRLVAMVVIALVAIGGGWLLLVSPERHKAADLQTQVAGAQQQLQSAQTEAASARSAEAQYTTAYASIVSLGKAVPPTQEVPSLVYQIDQATGDKRVEFNSITSGTAGGSGSGSASAAATAAADAATPTAFTPLPFTFVFKGSYYQLYRLIEQVNGFARRTASGGVHVSGRLLTIQGADITLEQKGDSSGGSTGSELTATVTATAYALPSSQGLTGGATPAGPAGSATQTSAGSASSPTTPAVVKVTP